MKKIIYLFLVISFSIMTFNSCEESNDVPEGLEILYPLDKTMRVKVDTVLEWKCTDPDNDQIFYKIALDTIIHSGRIYADKLTDCKLKLSGLKEDKLYYWRVIASDDNGGVLSTFTSKFTTAISVDSIKVENRSYEILTGGNMRPTLEVFPSDASVKSVTLESLNTEIATVDTLGQITAVTAGTVAIKVTSNFDSKITSEFSLVVSDPINVTTVSMSQESANIHIGDEIDLIATISPENATYPNLTWISSDETKATITAEGKVVALALGESTISATSHNAIVATCKVIISEIPVTTVTINKTTLSLIEGTTEVLTTEVGPENAANKTITWSSSDETKATVSAEGVVTAILEGEVTITGKSINGIEASCVLTVSPVVATGISLPRNTLTLQIDEVETLEVTITPITSKDKTTTWSSSDTKIATVDVSGNVKAIAVGEAIITVTSANNIRTSCTVTVISSIVEVNTIALDKTTLSVPVGGSESLIATLTPDNASYKTVTWSSSDDSKATVSTEGVVTGVNVGSATITAKSHNNKYVTCEVTITKIDVTTVTLNKTTLGLTVGNTETLTTTVLPVNATNSAVSWSSSDESVATVDASGTVNAIAAGNSTITATSADQTTIKSNCVVTVSAVVNTVDVTTVTSNKSDLSLTVGNSETLTVTVLPANATNKTVTWSSSDIAIATVDAAGSVSAISAGSAVITATSADQTTVKSATNITVSATTSTGVTIEGKLYKTVTIDGLTWLAENLAVVPAGATVWTEGVTNADASANMYATYNDEDANKIKYGYIYTHEAAKAACPTGWRLPTKLEWKALSAIYDESVAFTSGTQQKSTEWNGDNSSGMNVLAGGFRNEAGTSLKQGEEARFWLSDESGEQAFRMLFKVDNTNKIGKIDKVFGLSVRCVKE